MSRLTNKQTAEQQAELARLREEKKTKKARATAQVVEHVEQDNTQRVFNAETEDAERFAKISSAFETLMEGFQVPSWKRAVTGLIVGMLAAAGTGYLIGSLAGLLIVSAVAVTSMAWIGWVLMILSIALGAWAGGKVGASVFGYIVDQRIDEHYNAAKAKVSSWFRAPAITQFSGAHEAS